jgi:hypothetical protein
VAHKDIQPAEDWSDEVLLALRTADALLALVHRDFLDSEWTGQEVGFALGRGTLVLAVKLGEEPPGFLRRVQALPGQGKSPRSLAREVFLLLARHKQTRRPMAEALARGFEGTDGPSEAEDNMTWLEEMDYWDSQLSARLRSAIQKNHILADAWGVHERVEELIRRRNESYIAPVMRRGA